MPTYEKKVKKARQNGAEGLHSAHCARVWMLNIKPDRSTPRLSALHRKRYRLSACLANPSPMLLSGFLMPEIQRTGIRPML
jgi:hypothetical protein